jgi:hypothetical protein
VQVSPRLSDPAAANACIQMIILVRHAQSEGNKNRDVHQFIPDHRIKLTPDGWNQVCFTSYLVQPAKSNI